MLDRTWFARLQRLKEVSGGRKVGVVENWENNETVTNLDGWEAFFNEPFFPPLLACQPKQSVTERVSSMKLVYSETQGFGVI